MKLIVTEDQLQILETKISYRKVLDEMVFKLSMIIGNEEREPDMEWDFTDVKKDLDLSTKWVKTKEDVLEYLSELKNKILNLPQDLKKKILRYVLYSFLGILSLKQIQSFLEPPLQTAIKTEKRAFETLDNLKIRKSSEKLIDHLKYEEGSIFDKGEPNLTAYDINDGAYTIGYGHAIFPGENEGYDFLPRYNKIKPGKTSITKDQAETLLIDDVKEAEKIINEILDDWETQGIKPKITQGMYDAMVSMAFNMGRGIRMSEFIQAVKRGELKLAKDLILQTSSHLFDNYPGLKSRREREYKMFS